MYQISEDLVRKRAEHNERQIGSLEELSLHQEDLCKLEHLQHWCKDLKILLLHNNLISKIENIGKLKKLEYINFSLNNIEKIENLEACESLEKLDFTLNFIGDLLSVEHLKNNIFLETLTLTGNPCTDYTGYRHFVIATLQQLKCLDGIEILKSDRIQALQNYDKIREEIIIEQHLYLEEREKQRNENELKLEQTNKQNVTQEVMDNFWTQQSEHTPEDRVEIAVMTRKSKEMRENKKEDEIKREPNLFNKEGKPYNMNQGKMSFHFEDDLNENCYKLDLSVYKHLDTNFIDVDIQPTYIRVAVKKKIFQLRLEEEVSPDKSKASRSQTTGHLLVIMPKAKEHLVPTRKQNYTKDKNVPPKKDKTTKREYLEIDEKKLMNISKMLHILDQKREDDFVDDPEVPPLE